MSFCKYCGTGLADGITVCDSCQAQRSQAPAVPVVPAAQYVAPPVVPNAPVAQVQQAPRKKSPVWIIIPAVVVFIGIFLSIVVIIGGNLGGELLAPNKDEKYIAAAKDIISDLLKNPSTAIFNEAYMVEEDEYGRAIVFLDVTADNSFGGSVRSKYYVCVQSVDGDGSYEYLPYASYVKVNGNYDDYKIGALKSANSFGEPQDTTE